MDLQVVRYCPGPKPAEAMSLNLIDQAAQRKRIEEILSNPVESAKVIADLRQQLILKEHQYDVMKASAEVLAEQCDKMRQQLETSQKREVMLNHLIVEAKQAFDGVEVDSRWFDRGMAILDEALAATADLSSLVICDAEPVGYNVTTMDNKQILMRTACHIVGHVSEPLYARKEQK